MTQQELKALLISNGVKEDNITKVDNKDAFFIHIPNEYAYMRGLDYNIEIVVEDWEVGNAVCWISDSIYHYCRFYDNIYTLSRTIGIYHALKS